MGLEITVANVNQLRDGVWETELAPREIRTLGVSSSAVGPITVMLLSGPIFDSDAKAIRFAPQSAVILNIGNTSRTIIVSSADAKHVAAPSSRRPALETGLGPVTAGDAQYLRSLAELPNDIRQAGESILQRVREHFPGDLRAVGSRRFQETPDNFWFVTIQPRDRSLSSTVRGLPDRFHAQRLKIVEDRRPYSRFKVKGLADAPEAVQVILNAVRRRA